ncbi:MerR family transcriptional regulator [Lactiplantibacillus plantarum subsp. plantarum]|nr:MerR family transcriptional regulator [Lactiplantibacillus plantarum subsp. plantarum]
MAISAIRQYISYVMAGPQSIAQRRELLTTHRNAILAQQAQIMKNLKEVDYKLNLYSDPHARELVQEEIAQAKSEKQALGLADPFPVTE